MSQGFINVDLAAGRWGISTRRARTLCVSGRVPGAIKEKNTWLIPENATKPDDKRVTSGKYVKTVRLLSKGKRQILIADDDELNREILKQSLKNCFVIYEACDGEETIKKILENKENLSMVFLDLIMPKHNGIEVMKLMQRHGLLDKIPVIMITGESTEESDCSAYENGAADIIYKPFSGRVVLQRALNIIELYEHRFFLENELERRTQELTSKIQEQLNQISELEEKNKLLSEQK